MSNACRRVGFTRKEAASVTQMRAPCSAVRPPVSLPPMTAGARVAGRARKARRDVDERAARVRIIAVEPRHR